MYWSGLINPHWPSTTQTPFENTILSSWQHTQGIQRITQIFELYYNAQYQNPPRVSLYTAIERWKLLVATEQQPNPKPTVEQYD